MREYKDIIGGGLLILIGGFAAIHAVMTLRLGTIWQMGPGMFPTAVGVMIALFGVGILIAGMLRTGEKVEVDLRSLLMIALSVLAFAVLIKPFGLVPAIVALIFVSARADGKLSFRSTAMLAGGLSLMAVLIFQIGLRMPLSPFSWPW